MIVVITDQQGNSVTLNVDDLADIETEYAKMNVLGDLTPALQTAINTQYGTPQTRAQNKVDFQNWMDDVNTAIANTENDLPAPTLANLATITAIVNELNAIRRRQNRIMKAIRYIARLLFRLV